MDGGTAGPRKRPVATRPSLFDRKGLVVGARFPDGLFSAPFTRGLAATGRSAIFGATLPSQRRPSDQQGPTFRWPPKAVVSFGISVPPLLLCG